jgi:hypothetical protein
MSTGPFYSIAIPTFTQFTVQRSTLVYVRTVRFFHSEWLVRKYAKVLVSKIIHETFYTHAKTKQ